jgi:hypothetical protein
MHALGVFTINAIIALFFIGLAGSAVVVLISFVEDFHELFNSDDSVTESGNSPKLNSATAGASLATPKSAAR